MFDKIRKYFNPSDSLIEFRCFEEDWDVIPKPIPARKFMESWYKKLAPKTDNSGCPVTGKLASSTIKRCPPFLDAMTDGWIIPLAGDVEITTNEDASGVDYSWSFYKPLIENHNFSQIGGNAHPAHPCPPMKWLNYWSIKVPKGYSVLFTDPFNRKNPHFTCSTGKVYCDGYEEFINFPFFFTTPNFQGIIEAGTPLVQVIPIKRDTAIDNMNIRTFTTIEMEDHWRTKRKLQSHESYYRDNIWRKS